MTGRSATEDVGVRRSRQTAASLLRVAAWWVGFFAFVCLYMVPQWERTTFVGARIGATTREVAGVWVVGPDYGSYFQAALSWYRDGVLSDEAFHWVTNIWPPGMVFTEYGIIHLVGMNGRFMLALVILTALVWATVLTAGLCLCVSRHSQLIYVVGVVCLFLTPPFSAWVAGDYFALPTGFAVAFTLLALAALGRRRAVTRGGTRWPPRADVIWLTLVVGPLLSLALLFRVASLWTVYAVLGVGVVIGVLLLGRVVLGRIRHEGDRPRTAATDEACSLLTRLGLISIIPLATATAWAIVVSGQAHPDRLSYTVNVPELAYGAPWRSDEQLIEAGSDWLLSASSNWACRIDARTCRKVAEAERDSPRPYAGVDEYTTREYFQLAVVAAATDPIGYARERAPKAWTFWSYDNAAHGVVMLAAAATAIVVAVGAAKREHDLQAIVFLGFVVTATLPMLWILFYYYYFIPLQVGAVFYLLVNQDRVRALFVRRSAAAGEEYLGEPDPHAVFVGARATAQADVDD